MKTFEKPLSAKEESMYIEKYLAGDEAAGDVLILRNMRLVAHMVKKYCAGADSEELISIGTVGLIKAVRTFRKEKGNRFATYAARCIDNELLMSFRSDKKRSREISLCEPIGTDKEGNSISIIDICESKDKDFCDNYLLKSDIDTLHLAVEEVLDEREKEIIYMRYGLFPYNAELPQREIAEKLGISRSYVSRIEKKALEKLRVFFDKYQ